MTTQNLITTRLHGDEYGTLMLTGLIDVEICMIPPDRAMNMTAEQVAEMATLVGTGKTWPNYPPRTGPHDEYLVCPDAMAGVWARGATYEEASEALCDRMLELLRDLPRLFDILAEGADFEARIGCMDERYAAERESPTDAKIWRAFETAHAMETAARLTRAAQALAALGPVVQRVQSLMYRGVIYDLRHGEGAPEL